MLQLGYAEDALTLWLVQHHLEPLLHALGDDSAAQCVFYRPSFGRRGSSRRNGLVETPRPAFGEFDVIVGSARGVYLLESKWSGAVSEHHAEIRLRDEQVRRHEVMRCYLEAWRASKPGGWATFRATPSIGERLRELGVCTPRESTRLACNLQIILGLLAPCGPKIRDVLVFFRTPGGRGSHPKTVHPDTFTLMNVECRIPDHGQFVSLSPDLGSPAPRMWVSPAPREDGVMK
jgi:hypothetical protein